MASSIGASKASTGSGEDAAGHGSKVHQPALSKPWEWKSVKPSKDLLLSPKPGKKDEMNLRKGVVGSSPSSRANEAAGKSNEPVAVAGKSKADAAREQQQPKIRAGGMEASKAEDDKNSGAMGLKLGKRTYLEDGGGTEAGNKPPPTTPTTPTQAAPCWKKGRGSPQGNVTPKCQVEGCKADLACSKDYHRRHKVCEVHSKTPKNTVNGQEQRFCQQCSRFHLLAEFDEGKRSCRRRLAGHNERRRKPQPDALAAYSMGNGSSFQASYQRLGSSIIVDGHGDAIAYGGGSWGRLGHQQLLGKQLPENLSAEKLLMLLQNSKRPATATASMAKKDQIGLTLSSSPGGGMSSSSSHSHGVTSMPDSSRALSLLSSEPWSSATANESPSSVSYDHHLSAAANNNNSGSTQYLMMGGGDHVSSAKKFQQAHQAQDAIPISSSSSGSSNKGQQQQHPYASPIRMAKSFENHSSMLALMQGQALQARPAIDLMRAPSSQQASQQQKRSSPGTNQYMHSMKPFESPVFESQQML